MATFAVVHAARDKEEQRMYKEKYFKNNEEQASGISASSELL
jgi:hypothetical protein